MKFNLGFVSEAGAISDAFQPHLNMFPMKALIQVFPLTSFEIAVFYDSKSLATFLHGDPHSDRGRIMVSEVTKAKHTSSEYKASCRFLQEKDTDFSPAKVCPF